LAGDFPYDSNWIAVLLSARDCENDTVEGPAVAYVGGIVKTVQRTIVDEKYNFPQVFFQKYRTMEECT
jgi:hypothetical protein